MQPPEFISTDIQQIINDLVAAYEADTGKSTTPGQNERLILNEIAYREFLIRTQMQAGCVANLVDFAIAPNLDYLAALVGVTRLPAEFAVTTIRFNLTSYHADGTIPSGIRVSTNDGKCIFSTSGNTNFLSTDTYVDCAAICNIEGTPGNGYIINSMQKLIDTLVFVSSLYNTTESAGGVDQETDEQLRIRIKIAPESFSCAGSRGSYEFWARTASALIVDVYIPPTTNDTAGTVIIYPLISGGIATPTEILNAVAAICSDESVRPLCDTVTVESPTPVGYSFSASILIKSGAVWTTVHDKVIAALEAACLITSQKIGATVYKNQMIATIMEADYNVLDVTTSFTNQVPTATQFMVVGAITITQS